MDNEKIALVAVLVAVVAALIFSVYTMLQSQYFGSSYRDAMRAQNPNDICATPSGYTDEQWREHMGHHPDMYAQCLNQTR